MTIYLCLILLYIRYEICAYRTIVASFKIYGNARIHELHCNFVFCFYLIKNIEYKYRFKYYKCNFLIFASECLYVMVIEYNIL